MAVANAIPPPTVGPRANIKLSGTVLRGRPFSGAAAASGAGCSGAVAAPLPCGPVPALKLRRCHATTLSRGTSAPATCRQPSSSAVQSGGAHALAALPVVAKIHKARRSRQVCHCYRFHILSGGTPYKSAALVFSQSPQPIHCRHIGHVSIPFYISNKSAKSAGHIRRFIHCHVLLIPIKSDGLPYDSAASHTQAVSPYGIAVSPYSHTPDAFFHTFSQILTGRPSPHTFSADPPYNSQAPKNPTPNPERPAAGLRKPPTDSVTQVH